MLQHCSLGLIFVLLQLGLAEGQKKPVTVPPGTEVEIELLENISSQTLHAGQAVAFKVLRPVLVDGVTRMPAETAVVAEVRSVQTSGAWRKAGKFDLGFRPISLEDGSTVQLDFRRPKLRGTRGEKTATAIATPLVLTYYFPLIPVALIQGARKGQPYEIHAGERYLVYVVAPTASEQGPRDTTPSPQPAVSPAR